MSNYNRRISFPSKKLDLSSFILFADCEKGVLNYKDFTCLENESDVYAIQFGGDLYIGSSINIKKRIYCHFKSLSNNTHPFERVQEAYNKTKSFKVYILFRCVGSCEVAEQMMIRLLKPSLNKSLPLGEKDAFNTMLWHSDNKTEKIIDFFYEKQSRETFNIERSVEKNIRELVKSNGFTQKQIVSLMGYGGNEARLGLTPPSFTDLFSNPSLVKLIKLSQILDVPLSELVKPSNS